MIQINLETGETINLEPVNVGALYMDGKKKSVILIGETISLHIQESAQSLCKRLAVDLKGPFSITGHWKDYKSSVPAPAEPDPLWEEGFST